MPGGPKAPYASVLYYELEKSAFTKSTKTMIHYKIYLKENYCGMICSIGCWIDCISTPKYNLINFYNQLKQNDNTMDTNNKMD